MKGWKWKNESGFYARNGNTESLKVHSYFDENGQKVASMWIGKNYCGWRCFRLKADGENAVTESFFYADSVKEGKSRLEAMFESEILSEVVDMAKPNLSNNHANHKRL